MCIHKEIWDYRFKNLDIDKIRYSKVEEKLGGTYEKRKKYHGY